MTKKKSQLTDVAVGAMVGLAYSAAKRGVVWWSSRRSIPWKEEKNTLKWDIITLPEKTNLFIGNNGLTRGNGDGAESDSHSSRQSSVMNVLRKQFLFATTEKDLAHWYARSTAKDLNPAISSTFCLNVRTQRKLNFVNLLDSENVLQLKAFLDSKLDSKSEQYTEYTELKSLLDESLQPRNDIMTMTSKKTSCNVRDPEATTKPCTVTVYTPNRSPVHGIITVPLRSVVSTHLKPIIKSIYDIETVYLTRVGEGEGDKEQLIQDDFVLNESTYNFIARTTISRKSILENDYRICELLCPLIEKQKLDIDGFCCCEPGHVEFMICAPENKLTGKKTETLPVWQQGEILRIRINKPESMDDVNDDEVTNRMVALEKKVLYKEQEGNLDERIEKLEEYVLRGKQYHMTQNSRVKALENIEDAVVLSSEATTDGYKYHLCVMQSTFVSISLLPHVIRSLSLSTDHRMTISPNEPTIINGVADWNHGTIVDDPYVRLMVPHALNPIDPVAKLFLSIASFLTKSELASDKIQKKFSHIMKSLKPVVTVSIDAVSKIPSYAEIKHQVFSALHHPTPTTNT